MKLNWNFLGGWGCKTKKPSVGGGGGGYMDIFCNCAIQLCSLVHEYNCNFIHNVYLNDLITMKHHLCYLTFHLINIACDA